MRATAMMVPWAVASTILSRGYNDRRAALAVRLRPWGGGWRWSWDASRQALLSLRTPACLEAEHATLTRRAQDADDRRGGGSETNRWLRAAPCATE